MARVKSDKTLAISSTRGKSKILHRIAYMIQGDRCSPYNTTIRSRSPVERFTKFKRINMRDIIEFIAGSLFAAGCVAVAMLFLILLDGFVS